MFYLIIASCIWSFSFGLIGNQLVNLPPATIAAMRLFIAALIFLPFIRRISLKNGIVLFVIGMVQFGLMSLAYMASFRYLKSHEIALFTIMTPLYIVGLHGLWHRKLPMVNMLAALMAVFGAGVILWHGYASEAPLIGFILVEASNLCFAIGQLAYREYLKTREHATPLNDHHAFAWLYLGGVMALLPFSLYEITFHPFVLTLFQLSVIVYLGIVASGLGFFFWNSGARRVQPGVLAVMNNLKIPLSVAVSLFIFAEQVNISSLLAGGVLLGVALIPVLWRAKKCGPITLADG